MTENLVSVVIPSYNHKKYIEQLLISVRSQSYQNIEIIVIDDGSTDGSSEFLKSIQDKYKLHLICKKNEGLCATINKGLDLVRGQYITIIASDDFMPEKRIEEQVRVISTSPYDAIGGGMTIVDENSAVISYFKPLKSGEIFFNEMLFKNLICAPTVMFKAEAFSKFGRYNPDFVIEDLYMWLKILSKGGRIANFNYNWAYYRKNPALTRKKMDWYYQGLMQVLKEYKGHFGVVKVAIFINFIKYWLKVIFFRYKFR